MDRSAIFWVGRLVLGGIGALLTFAAVRLLGRARAAANWPTAAPVNPLARPLGWTGIGAGLLGLAAAAGLSLGALAGPPEPALSPHTWRGWLVVAAGGFVVLAVGAASASRLVNRAELTALIRIPPRMLVAGPDAPPAAEAGAAVREAGAAGREAGPAGREAGAAVRGAGAAARDGGPKARDGGPKARDGEPTLIPPPPAPLLPAQARPDGPAGQHELSTPVGGVDPAVPSGGRSGWVYRDPAGDWYLAVATEGGQRLVRLTDFTLVPVGTVGSPLSLEGSVEIQVWPVTDRVTGAP
ncbi:MAG: hypothetical protein AUI14_25610 [Actinobacteria bacterium 13_2_20CM_2_71_6]|nr:MAG: hypothetical protein AUI14_25610 [Actinobacteria bacterium 13_2_20CM_2_71_6]